MLIEVWYAALNQDESVAQFENAMEDDSGPNTPIAGPYAYRKLNGAPPADPQPTPRHTLMWRAADADPVWVETVTLADAVVAGISKIDAAANNARERVLAQPTNTEEYHVAAKDAQPFKDAGYPAGAVPESVQAWADAKWRDGWTAQMAADDILATAAKWDNLLKGIRRKRLLAKEDVRHAADGAAIDAVVQQFLADLSALMSG